MKNYFRYRKPEHINIQLKAMKELMNFFRDECGVYTFLTYGSLLGAVRNKDVIPDDTDYDIAYFSKENTIEGVRKEAKRICEILIKNNMLGKIWFKGGQKIHPTIADLENLSGQMHVQTPGRELHIDVYNSWALDKNFYMCYGIHGHLNKYDIVPFGTEEIRGILFTAPKNPKAILDFMYGKDWMIPKIGKGSKYSGEFKRMWSF